MKESQKKELDILLKARKRADKVLAERRDAETQKHDYQMRREANQELKKKYTQELTGLAQESGILALAEQAALERTGCLTQQVSYFIDRGMSTSCVDPALVNAAPGVLRPAYLALRITWRHTEMLNEAEIRIFKNGQVAFHNCIVPVLPFFWRRYPQVLSKMLTWALEHPRPAAEPEKKDPNNQVVT